ncbi:GCN5 family acetyltransferase [Cupriavidus sp. UYMU48A]|nr:GCN5 family acetyltransferase [Cupriavidus sp. UYMU48A]
MCSCATEAARAVPLTIRAETPEDADAIAQLTEAAFLDALHSGHTEAFIVAALRRAGQLTISLVAQEQATTLLGHIAFSPVSVSDGSGGWYGLGPVSVQPSRQREGIGTALMEAGLAALRARGAAGCVVLGDPAYYGRFGFAPRPELVLPGVPPEYFQALAFDGGQPAGQVAYHEAFAATA